MILKILRICLVLAAINLFVVADNPPDTLKIKQEKQLKMLQQLRMQTDSLRLELAMIKKMLNDTIKTN